MLDKNLDTNGYLTYTEDSTSVRKAVSKALKIINLHANGNGMFSNDLIYGDITGSHRTDYRQINTGHYSFAALAIFLFVKRYLDVIIDDEDNSGELKAEIIFHEIDMKSFKGKLSRINNSTFRNQIEENSLDGILRVYPNYKSYMKYNEKVIFSIDVGADEIIYYDAPNNRREYALVAPDIFFPKNYTPFES